MARRRGAGRRRPAQSLGAGEFSSNYSRWQAAKTAVLNEALQGKLAAREATRRVAEEVNTVLAEAYPQP